MSFRVRVLLLVAVLLLILVLPALLAPPRPTPELRAACFQMDVAIAKLEIDADQLARSGQPAEAFQLQLLIAKARAEQQRDHCPE